jgi:hypothetical protein
MQMVNVWFPERTRYGFEMVDGPIAVIFAGNRRQSKIYTESNQPDFFQIFADLSSIQTLTIYRGLLVGN